MQIGLDSYSFHIALAAGRYDVFRALDWLADHGFAGVQLNINGPRGRFLGGEPNDSAHIRRVRRHLERLGLFVEIGGRGTAPEMLSWQLRLCFELGADVLRTLLVFQENLENTLARTQHELAASLSLARSLGVRIALENHEDVTAAELRRLLDMMDEPFVGACLDTGNDLVVYGEPLAAARQLASRTITTHIKDHKLVRVNGMIYSAGVPLGAGDIDLARIMPVILEAAPVDRILLQNTTGYAAALNPFKRPDLKPPHDYAHLPVYKSASQLRRSHIHLEIESLTPADLAALAERQEQNLINDLSYLQRFL